MVRVLVGTDARLVDAEAFFTFSGDSRDDGLGQGVSGVQVLLGAQRKLEASDSESLIGLII